MGKIRLILNVLVFIAMTMSFTSAAEESRENPLQGMIERHDRDGDGKVSIDEFHGPGEHFTRIDLDGDGAIQQSEARHGPPDMTRQDRGDR